VRGPPLLEPIVGQSAAIRRARDLIERYAPTPIPFLLVGATGTGKELIARHLHALSTRRGRFVAVNCGALPREMAEGLLFGYERGAFSGAVRRHRGHIECADEGTLFLDELLSLPPDGQAMLLRALDTGEIQRLGEETERRIDVRVIGAVQDDQEERLARGAFRRDLYQRLAGVVLELPPLAERMEDVLPLAEYFATQRGQRLEAGTSQELMTYGWPGNVRELRQVNERAGQLVENGTLPAVAVAEAIALGRATCHATDGERERLLALGGAHDWDVHTLATAFGMGRTRFYKWLKDRGIRLRDLKREGSADVRGYPRTAVSTGTPRPHNSL